MEHLNAKRVAWVLATSALAGCAGNVTSEPPDGIYWQVGGGGQGGTPTTGAGASAGSGAIAGSGASGATGTGGVGAAAGSAGAPWGAGSPSCTVLCEAAGGTCTAGGDCLFEEATFSVGLVEQDSIWAGGGYDEAHAIAWLTPAGTLSEGVSVLGVDGPCEAIEFPTGPAPLPLFFDAGGVTVTGPHVPPTTLKPKNNYFQPFAGDVFVPGDLVAFDATGGPDFPAFAAQAAAPDELEVTIPAKIYKSQPLTISWSPPEPPLYVLFGTSATPKAIICLPTDPGSLDVPPSLMALLDTPMGYTMARASGERRTTVSVDAGASAKALVAVVKWAGFDAELYP